MAHDFHLLMVVISTTLIYTRKGNTQIWPNSAVKQSWPITSEKYVKDHMVITKSFRVRK
jgi:hypothetical protein